MAENLIFAQTIEGLLRALQPLEPEVRAGLKRCGIDPDGRLLPAYPLDQFIAALDFVGAHLAPGRPRDEQTRVVGHRFMDAYQQTMIGRAMVAAMRVIGPRRTLERLAHKFRTGNNFSQTRLTQLGPTEAEVWCNQTSRPGWYIGLITRGLELAGAKDVTVKLISQEGEGARFHVKWA